ncbi:hypothetical protein GH714_017816 [Hevea brasiliensis]|uniref:NB-ARC domain-containing protein n=1 Tax=Hevea brasiliensis TaxID=3981 RepID=A0A6A6N459_HEVBR|nr:hypothetical protein GH714_017816 [Hevea brasiliensis]
MWLDSLRDLAYDVEDILDEFATEILQRQLKDESQASSSNLRKLSHTVGTTINPVAVMFNSKMMSKMKQITTRFQEIVDQQKDLDLINRNVGGTSFSKVCVRPPSTCLHHEPRVYGRDEDKRKIIDLISSIEASDVKVGVIPIVGMDEDCWKLFLDHAFDSGSVADPKVEVIREKVINKCGGLPLAARTLGGLLRSKPQEHWEDVMNSEIWNSQEAISPSGMAEGLIEQRDDQHMEDVGEEYFQDLLSRLFQFSSTGGFVMHDLVNDLAQVVAGDTYFRLEEKSSKKEKARYSSYIPCRFDRRERFEPFENHEAYANLPAPITSW